MTFLALHTGPLDEDRRRQHEEQLEARFLATDFYQLCRINEGEDADVSSTKEHLAAAAFLKEYRLHQWVQSQNRIGLAPTTGMIRTHVAGEAMGTHGSLCKSPPWLPASTSASKIWVRRFQQRWNIAKGSAQPREPLELQARRDKVDHPKMRPLGLPFSARLSPQNKKRVAGKRPLFCGRPILVQNKWRPFSGRLFLAMAAFFCGSGHGSMEMVELPGRPSAP